MDLSSIIGYNVKPYLEYGWVCAPNGPAQAITANVITTLSADTRISDVYGFGSINPSNGQLTLSAGTYYFDITAPITTQGSAGNTILGLYNVTTSSFVSRISYNQFNYFVPLRETLKGQFTIVTQSTFDVRTLCNAAAVNQSVSNSGAQTNSTPGVDQRTTIKLWKLA